MGAPKNQTITQKTEIPQYIKDAMKGKDITSGAFQAEQRAIQQFYGLPEMRGGGTTSYTGAVPQAVPTDPAAGSLGLSRLAQGYSGTLGFANGGLVGGSGIGSVMPENMSAPALAFYMAQAQQKGYANGGYVQGPGTGRSDSVPAVVHQNGVPVEQAKLSDGEFVMTERAVRGAGGGDRAAGAARLYQMMQRFEGNS